MVNEFIKAKIISADLCLTAQQEEDFISSLSDAYENNPDMNLNRIIKGVKERNIYYDNWIRNINVMI